MAALKGHHIHTQFSVKINLQSKTKSNNLKRKVKPDWGKSQHSLREILETACFPW